MEFTADNVIAAVHEFYRTSEKVNPECHEWLRSCQCSREAWNIVWPLLQPSQTVNVQFTASNILLNKVTRNLSEIPVEEYGGLKDNIIAAVARFVNGPAVVLTRLELTLGAFIASTIGEIWPNPLEDLGTVFQPQNFPGVPEEKVLKLLVEIFARVPEQAESVWQNSSRKGQTHRELQSKGESMFTWLYNMAQSQQNMDVVKEAINAMIPWMKMFSICEWSELHNLLDLLVNLCKKSVQLGDYSLCENCLEMLSSIIADPNTHLFPSVILAMLDKILPLQATLDVILELQDMEMAVTFYGVYVALADCHSRLVVDLCDEECTHNKTNPKNRANALQLLDILLRCVGSPGTYPIDEVVSSITISVWYSFVEEIQPKQVDKLKYGRLMHVFEWVYKSLAEILLRKAKFPEDDSSWSSEEKEQFRIYRQDVCDCFTYCYELRGWTMLNEITGIAEMQLLAVENNSVQLTSVWCILESLLMGIRAVTENISDDTDPVLAEPLARAFAVILRVLKLNQSSRIPKLYQAALECISSCSAMLHTFDGFVKNSIGFILEGLFLPESSSSATLALKTISRDCTRAMSEFTPLILNSCKQALDSGSLAQNDSIRLVYCIGKFLPYLPNPEIITVVNEIFAPSLQHLHSIAGQEAKQELRGQLIIILRIMSTLCSSLDQCDSESEDEAEDEMSDSSSSFMNINNNISSQTAGTSQSQVIQEVNPNVKSTSKAKKDQSSQPLIPVVEQILPVLVPLAEKWCRDEDVMETLFSILKHTLTTIHTASTLVIEYAIKLVIISFRLHPVEAATALAKQILLMIGREHFQTQCQFLQEMHSLAQPCLKRPRDNLDFAESYFMFIANLVKTNTELINVSAINLDFMLAMALEILNYSEAPLLKAGITFVQATLNKAGALTPPLMEFYRSQGFTLIQKMILAIGYVVPRSVIHYFAEIFLSLNRVFTGEWRKWLQDVLATPDFPSSHCSHDAKNVLYLKLTRERANKRIISDAISEFALACRNMSGTEYGAATSKRL